MRVGRSVWEFKIGLKRPKDRQLNVCKRFGVDLAAQKGPRGENGLTFVRGHSLARHVEWDVEWEFTVIFQCAEDVEWHFLKINSNNDRKTPPREPKRAQNEPKRAQNGPKRVQNGPLTIWHFLKIAGLTTIMNIINMY